MIDHMKTASVRDLRYRFPEIESRLRDGKEIEITKRRKVIARLVPASKPSSPPRRPDFLARLRKIYGNKVLKVTGADLVARERGPY
jgi:antitoxin (DNA-binding transcriptional repressor) of toxin-antitoxin stability system